MAEETVVEKVQETPVAETPVKEVAQAEDETLLGKATKEVVKTPEEKAKEEALAKETPEQKTAREATEKAAADALKVPETYDIKAPEGLTIEAKSLEALTPVFKELELSNAKVQKLVDAYAPIVKAQTEAHQKAAMDLWTKETDGWKAESLKQLGADASKELAYAAKVINKVGTQYKKEDGSVGNKLRDMLEDTRTGQHPEMTKLFVQLGKMISEDSFVEPSKTATGGKVDLYDHPDSKNLK